MMTSPAPRRIRIASRESQLAMVQSRWVAARLTEFYPGVKVEIIGMTTRGDQIVDQPLAQIGGKGLFIKELEVALEAGRADIAVHSMKDVPMTLPSGFAMTIVGHREDVSDAFVSTHYASLAALPADAIVGTGSLRRESQLRHRFPRLTIRPLRGNVNTRLGKLDAGDYDAIILATAGLRRLGFFPRVRMALAPDDFLPAIAQGALGIEYCTARTDLAAWLTPFVHPATTACVVAERAFGRALTASCDVPLGAHATIKGDTLEISGFVALPDGTRMIRDTLRGSSHEAESLGLALADKLIAQGAGEVLATLTKRG